MRIFAAAVLLLPAPFSQLADPAADDWSWPLGDHSISRDFDPPETPFGAGHRGVDLPGRPGDVVRSVAPGTVTFAGRVAGVDTVTITHGAERSTYQPVRATVQRGDSVAAAQPIGTLLGTRLNLGRRAGDVYRDPAELLGGSRVRLISPHGPPPSPPAPDTTIPDLPGGVVTSGYGWRTHPITGRRSFHDGVDVAAPCGTPVPTTAAGRVSAAGDRGGFGNYVEVDHGSDSTGYAHLSTITVAVGDRVPSGGIVGLVGTTGSSTGCHLHFRRLIEGTPVNPMTP